VEDTLTAILSFLVPIVEACGALVIIVEVGRTVIVYLLRFIRRGSVEATPLRFRLGQSMVLGIEFQVAADILKTALSPEWNDMLLLAALIGLRTVLNYLQERELEKLDARRGLSTGYGREPEV
jgi:uncharacterized membrane protein